MKLSIITINFNTQKLLEACLRSVKQNLNLSDYEVIVIDNASDKFNESPIKKIFPHAKIIRSKENLGFGRANNLAAKQAKGEYIWFLNSDTELPKNNKVEKLIEFLDNNTNYAAVSPLVVDNTGKPQAYQYGYFPKVWRMVLEKFSFSRSWKFVSADNLPLESRNIDWVSGAAMLVRKTMFNAVGGFAKEYFLYYEDVDLCKKFNANRYKIRFIKDAKVIHYEGASSSSDYSKKKIAYQSQEIYFKRWGSWVSRIGLKAIRKPYAKKWQAD
jgi:GT2 family glycosyltransferase